MADILKYVENVVDVTVQGNTFNGANQLVKLNQLGYLPSLNASNLTNFPATITAQGNTFNAPNKLVQLDGQSRLPAVKATLLTDFPTSLTAQGNTFNVANKLVKLDANGKLPAIDGGQLLNIPTSKRYIAANPSNWSADLGFYYRLDAVYNQLTLTENVRNTKRITFAVWSSIAGNIALNIYNSANTLIKSAVVAVTTTPTEQSVVFDSAQNGLLSIVRDTTNAADTLKDTDVVTALLDSTIYLQEG